MVEVVDAKILEKIGAKRLEPNGGVKLLFDQQLQESHNEN